MYDSVKSKNVLYIVCSYDAGHKKYTVKPKNIFKEKHEFWDVEVRDSIITTTLPRIKRWCTYYDVQLKLITTIPKEITELCNKFTELYSEESKKTNYINGFDLKLQKSKFWFIKFYILNHFCKSNYDKFLYLDGDAFFDQYLDIFSMMEKGIYFLKKPALETGPQYRLNKKLLNKIIDFFVCGNMFGGTSHVKEYTSKLVNPNNLSYYMQTFGPKIFLNDEVLLTNFFHDYNLLQTFDPAQTGMRFSAGTERIYQYVLKLRDQSSLYNFDTSLEV